MSLDVDGNDNTPEWGYCTVVGCGETAEPLWFSGGFPDDPDLLLCYKHTGERMGKMETLLSAIRDAAWAVQDDKGTRYCRFCEEREPRHYLSCVLAASESL